MALCTNGCGCKMWASGTNQVNFSEIVKPLFMDGQLLVNVFEESPLYKVYGSRFFDYDIEVVNGRQYKVLKFKNNQSFQKVKVTEDCAVEWFESVHCDAVTSVAVAAGAGSTTLTVTDVTALKGIGLNAEILVRTAAGTIVRANVVSIAGNTLTLAAPGLSGAVAVNDCVFRGIANRDAGCNTLPSNIATLSGLKKYKSYFRTLYVSMDFESCNNDLDRYVGGLDGYILQTQKAAEEQFLSEFVHSVFHDRNGVFTNASGNQYTETMGLLPAIEKAAADNGVTLYFDYSACCTSGDCTATQSMLKAFLKNIRAVASTGFYENGLVDVLMNQEAISDLHDMYSDLQELAGVVIMQNTNESEIEIPFLTTLKYMGLTIRFFYEKELDIIGGSFHLVMPSDKYFFVQREFNVIELNGQSLTSMQKANMNIRDGKPTIAYVDRTAVETNGFGRCTKIRGMFEYAVLWAGVDRGAYIMGKNLRACDGAACDVCAPAANAGSLYA